MSSHTSLHGEIREQQLKTKDMSLKGKLSYFWDYYKIHTVVVLALIAMTVMFIQQYRANKDYAFYAILINANTNMIEEDQWEEAFSEYAGIDTEEYATFLDTSFVYSTTSFSEYSLSSMEKLMVQIQTGMVDVVAAETGTFESQAQNEYYADLSTVLPKETLEKYKDYLYYTDAATFTTADDSFYSEEEQPNPADFIINHHDPSTMEQPIPVGICLPEGNKLLETGCYDHILLDDATYQGYPTDIVLGIPVTATRIDTILKFLEFIE